jgi:hypothetical protein
MQHQPDASLAGKNLSGLDLRGDDLTGKVLFATDLRGAKLYGARISLQCQTFDGAKLDNTQVAQLLLMLSLADIDPALQGQLDQLAKQAAGPSYGALKRLLRLA